MEAIGGALSRKYPVLAADPDFSGFGVNLVPLAQQVTGRDTRRVLWILLAAALILLLISCSNVGSMSVAQRPRDSANSRSASLSAQVAAGWSASFWWRL